MKRLNSIVSIVLFLTVIFGLAVYGIILPDKSFSDNENRVLERAPELKSGTLLSGEFAEKTESYLSDQIPWRDGWVRVNTAYRRSLIKKDINGVYLARGGGYITRITESGYDTEQARKNIRYISEFFDYCSQSAAPGSLTFMPVPTAQLINSEKLPAFAPAFDEDGILDEFFAVLDGFHSVDLRPVLAGSAQKTFYETDHHWTTHGAFLAYNEWRAAQGKGSAYNNSYKITTAARDFRGSLFSKVPAWDSPYDSIELYRKSVNDEVRLDIICDGERRDSLYDMGRLKKKDKYAVFMGGNYGEVSVKKYSKSEDSGSLLIIKDSYANCFLPFVIEDYGGVYMLDLRYYKGGVREYVRENDITDVLVLCGVESLGARYGFEALGL